MFEIDDLEAFAEATDVFADHHMIGLDKVALHRRPILEGRYEREIQRLFRTDVLSEIISLDLGDDRGKRVEGFFLSSAICTAGNPFA